MDFNVFSDSNGSIDTGALVVGYVTAVGLTTIGIVLGAGAGVV